MRRFVSEIYSILDCIFYDDGVTDPKTATWYDAYNRITVAIDNTGTKISTSTGNDHYWANNNTAITGNFICEFDLLEYADSRGVSLRFYDGTNNHYYIFKDKSLTGENHLRFVYDGSKISVQINDGTPTNFVNTSTGSYYIALRLNSVNDNLKYRNFKIYPI